MNSSKKEWYVGMGLAILATIIWSGNFIVARGVIQHIPPVSLAFYRWLTGSLIMLPLAWKHLAKDWSIIRQHKGYFFWTALSGITLFNTFVYVAGHHSPAINLALIGTTSSPVFAIVLAAIFLKERISTQTIAGLVLCLGGIVFLLSRGSLDRLLAFRFSIGDGWILLGALCFAVYNIFVRRKPAGLHPLSFLFTAFALGTLLLIPAFTIELSHTPPVAWNANLVLIIAYLGIGASVIAFLCWNMAIARMGAARTALFGNLIPIFSTLEAVWLLGEEMTWVHVVSGVLVIVGLLIANLRRQPAEGGGQK